MLFSTCSNLVSTVNLLTKIDYKLKITETKLSAIKMLRIKLMETKMIFWLSFFGCCVALRRILTVDNLKKIDLIIILWSG